MRRPRRPLSVRRKLLFSAVMTVAIWIALETGLRLAGFEASTRLETMAFTFPMDDYNQQSQEPFLERDPVLFWKPRPGVLGHNSLGCSGPEFSPTPEADVFRIVCLGDSCTHFGPDAYPAMLQQLLDQSAPGRFEVINAGVIGYSSYQGLQLLNTRVLGWQPDLVTVYFGWNDHWLARDFADKDQSGRLPALLRIRNAADHSRVVQLMASVVAGLRPPPRPGLRVELPDYAVNLRRMHELCESIGAEVWYLTAPHALDLGVPDYLYTSGEVDDPALLASLHRQFNAVVRTVAGETGSKLIDLESMMDEREKRSLFSEDHIHLSESGRRLVAEELKARMDGLPGRP